MKRLCRIILVAGLVAVAVWWVWPSRSRRATEEQAQPTGRSNGLASAAAGAADVVESLARTGTVDGAKKIRQAGPGSVERIHAVLEALRRAGGAEESQRILDELRFFLGTMTPSEASKTVRGFLDTRQDTPTQLGFGVGPDGLLKEAPSLRVFLLDYLATVDGAGAADYAQQVLSSPSSADEWARGDAQYAWGKRTAESRSYLEVNSLRWSRMNHGGTAECRVSGAFDVAVYVGRPACGAADGIDRPNEQPSGWHAAFLALDRMTLKDLGRDARGDAAATRSDERP